MRRWLIDMVIRQEQEVVVDAETAEEACLLAERLVEQGAVPLTGEAEVEATEASDVTDDKDFAAGGVADDLLAEADESTRAEVREDYTDIMARRQDHLR